MSEPRRHAERKARDTIRLQRRLRVWKNRCLGWSQQRIADDEGCNQGTVSRDLQWMTKRVLSDLDDWVAQVKVEQVHQLQFVVDEALQEWERSKGSRTASSVRRSNQDAEQNANRVELETETGGALVATRNSRGAYVVTSVTESEQVGNVTYLHTAMKAMTDMRRILGADAPIQYAHQIDQPSAPIQVREVIVEIPVEAARQYQEADRDNGSESNE